VETVQRRSTTIVKGEGSMAGTDTDTTGVYVSLAELIRLQHQAAGFSFFPRQPVHSLLAGRHASRLRGRGLDFEELRQYLPGDDIRAMDWKATRRTGHPYVRVYTEEKERPVLLLVDQRLSMFFGSRVNMKSVTAAHAAALAAWRVVNSGDRAGALVFNDSEIREVRPQRSGKTVMQILRLIVDQNRRLGVDRGIESAPEMLNRVLHRAARRVGHDVLVCVISDFFGLDDETLHWARQISRHNNLLLAPVYDPLARQLPAAGVLVVSDGRRQIRLDSQDHRLKQRFPAFLQGRLKSLSDALARFGVPILPLDTAHPVADQVRRDLGYVPGQQVHAGRVIVRGAR